MEKWLKAFIICLGLLAMASRADELNKMTKIYSRIDFLLTN